MITFLFKFVCLVFCGVSQVYALEAEMVTQTKSKTESKPSQRSLSLRDILESAEKFYPEIRSSHSELRAAEAQVESTLGYFDPMLTAGWDKKNPAQYASELFSVTLQQRLPYTGATIGFGYEKSEGKFASYDYYKDTGSEGRTRGFLNVPLLKGFGQDAGRTKILSQESKLSQMRQSYALTKLDASRLAGQRFFEWVAAVNRYRILRSLLKLAEDRQTNLDGRAKKGDLAQIDVLENMRQIFARRTLTLQTEVLVKNTGMQLSLFFRDKNGVPQVPKTEVAPELEETLLNPNQLLPSDFERILTNHPLLIVLDEQIKQKELIVLLTRNQILPKLDFNLQLQKEQGDLPPLKSIREETFAGLKLEFPLLNREARGAKSVAKFELESLKIKRAFARDKLGVDLQRMKIEADTASQVFELTAKEVEFSKKVEQAERIRFQQGDGSLFTVNLREQDKAQAEIKHLDAFLEWKKRIMDVGYFRGDNISESESNSEISSPTYAEPVQ